VAFLVRNRQDPSKKDFELVGPEFSVSH